MILNHSTLISLRVSSMISSLKTYSNLLHSPLNTIIQSPILAFPSFIPIFMSLTIVPNQETFGPAYYNSNVITFVPLDPVSDPDSTQIGGPFHAMRSCTSTGTHACFCHSAQSMTSPHSPSCSCSSTSILLHFIPCFTSIPSCITRTLFCLQHLCHC